MGRFAKLEWDDARPPAVGDADDGSGAPGAEEYGEEHYLQTAQAAMDSGDYETALRRYSRALQLNINLVEAWWGQVQALMGLEELEEALLWSDKALGRFRDHPDLLSAKAVAHARQANHDTAMAYSDAALAGSPLSQYVWLARGECLLAELNRNAKYCFLKALEHAPQDWRGRFCIGEAYLRCDFPVDAARYLSAAAQISSDSPLVWVTLGRARERMGLLAQAREAYIRALEVQPGFGPAEAGLEQLGRIGWLRRVGTAIARSLRAPRTFDDATPMPAQNAGGGR